ncbi:ParA family protein [Telmatospirillum siberiense]|nr:ParA family protein [Telmatospirillum siberiense]
MMIAIINNKGGTGKTTTCVNLAVGLAGRGHRVLVVDLDSQASASLALGVQDDALSPSICRALFDGTPVKDVIRSGIQPGVDLITAEMNLSNADLLLAKAAGRERRLNDLLAPVRDAYDYILCDCASALSLVPINALVAADCCLACLTPEHLAHEGLRMLARAIARLRINMGIDVQWLGILFTMVNPRLRHSSSVMAKVREDFGRNVLTTEIRRDVKLAEAPFFGRSIFHHAPASKGAKWYGNLVDEVIERCRNIPLKGRLPAC